MISIITPSFQRGDMIEKCIQSVLSQNASYEHIIVDGGSTDNTLKLLSRYPHIKVICEPDQGMYDALNKGIAHSKGDIIGFINTDDFYEPDIFLEIENVFHENKGIDIFWASANFVSSEITVEPNNMRVYHPIHGENALKKLLSDPPLMNACFFRRELFELNGYFWTNLKIASDREFMVRQYIHDSKFLPSNKTIYNYLVHNSSMTMGNSPLIQEKILKEHCVIAEHYLRNENLSSEQKNEFRNWHSFICLRQFHFALKKKQIRCAYDQFINGWKYDPFWLTAFLKKSVVTGLKSFGISIADEYSYG